MDENGIMRLRDCDNEYDGYMFYIDPEKGPCMSKDHHTVVVFDEYNVWDLPGYYPYPLDVESILAPYRDKPTESGVQESDPVE